MKVRINGIWYNSECDNIALSVTPEELSQIKYAASTTDASDDILYGSFPEDSAMTEIEMREYLTSPDSSLQG